MNHRKLVADISLIVVITIIGGLLTFWIFNPMSTDYEFQTITKVSELYENPIYLIFHWKTEDELQVGNLITLWIEIKGLPYLPEDDLDKIKVNFLEKDLNYFNSETDLILPSDSFEFNPDWDNKVFRSNESDLRFIVPNNISIQYCDYNQINSCMIIENIIHPAPHDLAVQINTNKIGLAISLILLLLSAVIVWRTLRSTYVENRVVFESEVKQTKNEKSIEPIKEEPIIEKNKVQHSNDKVLNDNFYEKLKNSQPIAFLASLCMVVAAFTYTNNQLPDVYQNAVSAAFSFVFSFVLSLVYQIFRDKLDDKRFDLLVKIGIYFLFAVGILYLIFIGISFSSKLPQIPQILFSWFYAYIGVITILVVRKTLQKMLKKLPISVEEKTLFPITIAVSILSWVEVGAKLIPSLTGFIIDDLIVISLLLAYLAVMGIINMIFGFFSMIKKTFVNIKNPQPSKP